MSDTPGQQPPADGGDAAPGGGSHDADRGAGTGQGSASGAEGPASPPEGPPPPPGHADHPGGPPDAAAAVPQPDGFFETLVGVITDPVDTLRRVTRHPKIGWALVVLIGVALLNGLIGAGQFEAQIETDPAFREILPPEFSGVGVGLVTFATLVVTLLGTLIGAFAVHVAAKLFSGGGTFGGQFSGFGLAYFPMAFAIVSGLLGMAGGGVAAIGSLISFALFIWVLVLGVIATRENHGFSTGHAVGAVAVGAAFLVVGVIIITILIGLLIAGFVAALFA